MSLNKESSHTQRTFIQSSLRELAPLILLSVGLILGSIWSVIFSSPLKSSPPYLISCGILFSVAFFLGTRGVPRWSYSWIAIGIVATQALLSATLPTESMAISNPSSAMLAVAFGGPLLTVMIASSIAKNEWSNAFIFIFLYSMGSNIGLPVVLQQESLNISTNIELIRILLIVFQTIITGAAILAWNRNVRMLSLAFLIAGVLISGITAQLVVQALSSNIPHDFSFIDLLRLITLILLLTFAIGTVRRIFSGKGFISNLTALTSLDTRNQMQPPYTGSPRRQRKLRFRLSKNKRRHSRFSK
jgi:hypothetical protein